MTNDERMDPYGVITPEMVEAGACALRDHLFGPEYLSFTSEALQKRDMEGWRKTARAVLQGALRTKVGV